MGYNTDWNGELTLSRKLTPVEQKEWDTIQSERHDSKYNYGDDKREFPSIWCGFEVVKVHSDYELASLSFKGVNVFRWDSGEKTYEGIGWIKFFLNKLKEWSEKGERIYAEGEMEWRGEEDTDMGRVVIETNKRSTLPNGAFHQQMHIDNIIFDYQRDITLHI